MSSERSRWAFRTSAILAFLLTVCAALAAAEPPYLVADLNTQAVNGSALPSPYDYIGPQRAEMGGVLYFAAADPMHGQELWRSDGSTGGTRLVRDIRPGPAGSGLLGLTAHRGRIYFFADDGVWGLELWSSDGTREGTRLVRDICPGICPAGWRVSMASAGDRLYITTGIHANLELWRTDGTREGTRRIAGPCLGCHTFVEEDLTPLPDGRIFFVANHRDSGKEVWVSDGTPEGTRVLDLTPGPGGSHPSHLTALDGRVLFWTWDGDTPVLQISDGTLSGTRTVRRNFQAPAYDGGPAVWRGSLYFANDAAELWRTDGTPGGTVRLKTFETGPTPVPARPARLTPLADSVLFLAGDSSRGMALWRTRGTPGTTVPLKDPSPGPDFLLLAGLHRAGNRAFFLILHIGGRLDLWVTDGKAPGTRRASILCRDAGECSAPDLRDLADAGGVAFLTVHSTLLGSELWRSDGSAAGTFLVRDIHRDPGSSRIDEIAALDGRAFFTPLNSFSAPSLLWSSDGTPSGTGPVGTGAPSPQGFESRNGHLYFSGAVPWYPGSPTLRRQGLWRTDGTAAGTELLAGGLFDLDLLAFDGDLLFLRARDQEGTDQGTGVEPWRSDGTAAGTRQIMDINRQLVANAVTSPPVLEPGSSDPSPPVRLGAVHLFAADDGLTGRELWATDGTEAGTRRVRNINEQDFDDGTYVYPGTSDPDDLVRLGGVVLFAADDGLAGRELWVTDGTEAGTRRLRDLRPGTAGSSPHDLVEHGGHVYFFAAATGSGEELWRTDGTAEGTTLVRGLARQRLPSWGRELTVADGRLFFVADNEATGPELHVSDGTAAGTRILHIRRGRNGSYPQSLTAVDGLLIFAADDGAHGLEPWRSDGTAAGTHPLGDLAPGQAASSPASFTDTGDLLFFGANDGVHGRELWAVGW